MGTSNWIRLAKDRFFFAAIIFFASLTILPLLFILFYILKNGLTVINWGFLTSLPKPAGEPGGGISNAIVGTALLVLTASAFSIPLGVLIGIYLSENQDSLTARAVRISNRILQGVPSIVAGIVAYLWIVKPSGAFSVFSGGAALGFLMIPIIVQSTEETLKLVPNTLKEASLALGASYTSTILKVIVPTGLSGIVTGILLGVSRVIGETAPLLFTAFGNPFMSYRLFKPANALPLLIFNYALSPYHSWQNLAWGASVFLIFLVMSLNLISKFLVAKWKVQS
jgi:phosphate transport system permease protein